MNILQFNKIYNQCLNLIMILKILVKNYDINITKKSYKPIYNILLDNDLLIINRFLDYFV